MNRTLHIAWSCVFALVLTTGCRQYRTREFVAVQRPVKFENWRIYVSVRVDAANPSPTNHFYVVSAVAWTAAGDSIGGHPSAFRPTAYDASLDSLRLFRIDGPNAVELPVPPLGHGSAQEGGRKGDFHRLRLEALLEVGPSVFFSLAVIAVSFFPVFTLVDQEGRLFTPLAYTKTFSIALACLLAVTLDPAVRMLFARMDPFQIRPRPLSWIMNTLFVGKYYPEEKHPISRILFKYVRNSLPVRAEISQDSHCCSPYHCGNHGAGLPQTGPYEFMPPLNEGTILYMPTKTAVG